MYNAIILVGAWGACGGVVWRTYVYSPVQMATWLEIAMFIACGPLVWLVPVLHLVGRLVTGGRK